MSDHADLTLDPALRDLGKQVHTRYALALRIARAHWPAETPADVLASAVHTLFIELSMGAKAIAPPSTSPAGAATAGDVPPRCPVCESAMRDQRATKRGNQPDFKCVVRSCDGAVWLTKRNGSRP